MSREIKFRAWDKIAKDWEDDFHINSDGTISYVDAEGDVWLRNCILMQYTGLRDKNGVEIYESDIVKYNTGETWIVTWSGRGGFIYADNGNKDTAATNQLPDMHEVEVIGNIYENPELLEQKS